MKPLKKIIPLLALFTCGCTSALEQLKTDPAIVGTTGFWFQAGLDSSVTSSGIPLPSIKFGHGTIWRIGTSDRVTIQVGETTNGGSTGGTTSGQASLKITTEGTGSAIEAASKQKQ